MNQKVPCLRELWALRKVIFILLSLLLPVPFLLEGSTESRCAYVILVMAALWITEALPIAVTSLLPVFLFPMLGVASAIDVCSHYSNDTIMLFIGSLILAVAMEEVNLHKRVGLGVILILGARPSMLMFGLMLPTWFLSMWISDTAAASLMLPVITAVTKQLKDISNSNCNASKRMTKFTEDGASMVAETTYNDTTEETYLFESKESNNETMTEAQVTRIGKGLALCVAYGANIGGVTTLTGTPVNLVLQRQANSFYGTYDKGADSGVTFSNWIAFGFPLSLMLFIFGCLWLQIFCLRNSFGMSISENKKARVKSALTAEYRNLGHISFREIVVVSLFIILALLWILRDIPGYGGWRFLFKEDPISGVYVRDSTACILVVVLLFILPSRLPRAFCCSNPASDGNETTEEVYRPILNWHSTVTKIPWGVILLLGGGFAMADASTASGLSELIVCHLRVLSELDPWAVNLILCIIVSLATELTSNVATNTLLMPIMANLAVCIGVHPLYLMISATVSCSFAFMLPVATPPNALVFSTGYVNIPEMASAGSVMNIISIACLTLAINTWGTSLFGLDTFPDIFRTKANSTFSCFGGTMISTVASNISSVVLCVY